MFKLSFGSSYPLYLSSYPLPIASFLSVTGWCSYYRGAHVLYTFEDACHLTDFEVSESSTLERSTSRFKDGSHSLKWTWASGDAITHSFPSNRITGKERLKGGIKLWLYNTYKRPGEKLNVSFVYTQTMPDPIIVSQFNISLDFKGWRGIWVSYKESMLVAQNKIDQLTITAPETTKPTHPLFLDILRLVDNLHKQTRDKIVPTIGEGIYTLNDFWQQTYRWSQAIPTVITERTPSENKLKDLSLIEKRLENWFVKQSQSSVQFTGNAKKRWESLQEHVDRAHVEFENLTIAKSSEGVITGKPLFAQESEFYYIRFGSVMKRVLLPMALDYHVRSRDVDINDLAADQLSNLNGDEDDKDYAVEKIAGGDQNMQDTFINALGSSTPYTLEEVKEAIKAVNGARWERLLLLLEYIEDQGEFFYIKIFSFSLCFFLFNLCDVFANKKSAYKQYHSTETAMIKVQDDILRAIDNNCCVILLLLDLSAAFDTVDHRILLDRLSQRFGIVDNALEWFRSYLSDRHQVVKVNGSQSSRRKLRCGVPQGSVLGPILFLLYTSPLGDIMRYHQVKFHLYADDTQLYLTFKSSPEMAKTAMEACVRDIDTWMTANMLKMNRDKTELLVLKARHRPLPPLTSISVCDEDIDLSSKARNIGVIFDTSMSMENHITAICKSAFYHLRNISRIRKYLSFHTAEMLVHAFVSSRLDFCNSLLFGLPKQTLKKLQHVQNVAARIVTLTRKCEHITPVLYNLHWLPIEERIIFKLLLITFKCLMGLAPTYLSDMIKRYVPRRNLRSMNGHRLDDVAYNLRSYGFRAFSVASPQLWNALPLEIRSCNGISEFKRKLKTHLFRKAFS
ncbi:hypothetical protein ACROYT_G044545 [Oculina patagonica]